MSKEVALLAEEFTLLRSIAEDGARCAMMLDEALRPLFEPLLSERLLATQGSALCFTERGRQFLILTQGVMDGDPVAVARHRLRAACWAADDAAALPRKRSLSRIPLR